MKTSHQFPHSNSQPISITVINKFDKEKDFSIFGSAYSSFESLSERYLDQAEVKSSVENVPYSFIQKDILVNKYHIGGIQIRCANKDFVVHGLGLRISERNIKGTDFSYPFQAGNYVSAYQFQSHVIEADHFFTINGGTMVSGTIPANTTLHFSFFTDELHELRICKHPFAKILIEKIMVTSDMYGGYFNNGKTIRMGTAPTFLKSISFYLPYNLSNTIREFSSQKTCDLYRSMVDIFCRLDSLGKAIVKKKDEDAIELKLKLAQQGEELKRELENSEKDRMKTEAKNKAIKKEERRKKKELAAMKSKKKSKKPAVKKVFHAPLNEKLKKRIGFSKKKIVVKKNVSTKTVGKKTVLKNKNKK